MERKKEEIEEEGGRERPGRLCREMEGEEGASGRLDGGINVTGTGMVNGNIGGVRMTLICGKSKYQGGGERAAGEKKKEKKKRR